MVRSKTLGALLAKNKVKLEAEADFKAEAANRQQKKLTEESARQVTKFLERLQQFIRSDIELGGLPRPYVLDPSSDFELYWLLGASDWSRVSIQQPGHRFYLLWAEFDNWLTKQGLTIRLTLGTSEGRMFPCWVLTVDVGAPVDEPRNPHYTKGLGVEAFVAGHPDCYAENGAPVKCWKCGCTEQLEVVRGVVDVLHGHGPVCEYEVFCAECGTGIGYWAYGSFDPGYLRVLGPVSVVDRPGPVPRLGAPIGPVQEQGKIP